MPDDERLREALVELQELRDREARLLNEANVLFEVLNTLSVAETVPEAVSNLLTTTQRALGADVVGLLSVFEDGGIRVVDATDPVFDGLSDQSANVPIFAKARNVVDITEVNPWSEVFQYHKGALRSLVSVPISLGEGDKKGALIALHQDRARFTNSDRQVLTRISRMAEQSLKALELQSRNRLLAAVIDGSSSGFAIADAKTGGHPLVFVNKAFEALSGYSSEEVLGQNCRFLNDEDPASEIRADLRETVRVNGTGTFVLRNKRKDGEPFWNELSLFPVVGPDDTAEYLVATQTDVSARVRAQEESELNRRRMFEALSHTDDGFLLVDEALTVLFSNQRFGQILPAPGLDWMPGTDFHDNLSAHIKTIPETILAQKPDVASFDPKTMVEAQAQQELSLPDGRTLLLRVQRTVERGYVLSATDITPLKSTERTLRGRVAAIENAPDGIAIADADGRVVYANPSLCSLFDVSSEVQLIGRAWSAKYLADNNKERIDATTDVLKAEGQANLRLVYGPEGDDRRWHDVVLKQVDRVGVILIVRDITKQRAIRNKQFELTEQLDLARRQQILSQMAAGLAHDFNNLLSAITGSATLISGDDTANEKLKIHADRIAAAGTQAAYLVNRLLDLGRNTGDISEFDLREAIKSAVNLLSGNVNPGVSLQTDLGESPILVLGSPTEVTRIVLNLLLNAQDALGAAGGTLKVASSLSSLTEAMTPNLGLIDPDRSYAELYVEDDGPGIQTDVVEDIFEPYFTTKGAQGSGLGLATVASMVISNDGAIHVDTEPGRGTRFTIYWPTGHSTDLAPTEAPAHGHNDLTGHLILVVDDEEDVAHVVGTYLEALGAEVAVVTDPDLAIESVRDDPEPWSMIISDYNMGEMNGGDLVEAVAAVAPELPVVILTALSRRLADPRLSTPSVKAVFAKPPDLRQISQAAADHARTKKGRSE